MKLKSYLRGLGLGIIVTTIILVVTIKAANHEMTDAEVISKARELGMVETSLYANGSTTEEFTLENVTTKAPTQETTTGENSGEGLLAQETTANRPESTTATKPESTTPANQSQSTTATKPESTTSAKPQETTKREETTTGKKEEATTGSNEIVLVFENISSADKASRILYDAGVIQDVDSFNNYLSDNGYARKVGEGTFTFTKGMSFEEIAKVITRSR